ncbi:hypothetical protein ACIQU1_17475 [Streptomyces angustmyceticus]
MEHGRVVEKVEYGTYDDLPRVGGPPPSSSPGQGPVSPGGRLQDP